MIIKDQEKGMFTLETEGKVVKEVISGLWKNEDYKRYTDSYEKQLVGQVKRMGKWAKLCDMRDYKMSSVVDAVNEHLKWCSDNGLQETVCIVPQIVVKMQMQRTAKDKETNKEFIKSSYFETIEEAVKYLKEKGYL